MMYSYRARLVRVVDGDTLWLLFDLGFRVGFTADVRLDAINCPELATPQGVQAREFVLRWFAARPEVVAATRREGLQDDYGRYLATIWDPVVPVPTLNQALVDAGLATPYKPRKRAVDAGSA